MERTAANATRQGRRRRPWMTAAGLLTALTVVVASLTSWAAWTARADGGGLTIETTPSQNYIRAKGPSYITYTSTVTNHTSSNATDIEVAQVLPNLAMSDAADVTASGPGASYDASTKTASWSVPVLEPGQWVRLVLDIKLGEVPKDEHVVSTARIVAPTDCGAESCSATATLTVFAAETGADLTATAQVMEIVAADGDIRPSQDTAFVGDTVRFRATLTNADLVPMIDVRLGNGLTPHRDDVTCSPEQGSQLEAGGVMVCTLDWTVTAEETAAGIKPSITAYGRAKLPDGTAGALSTTTARASVTIADAPTSPAGGFDVSLETTTIRDANGTPRADASYAQVGDTISYQWIITNAATSFINHVGTDTDQLSPDTCTPATSAGLDVGEQMRCTGHHVVTDADLAAGKVTVSAWATAPWPDGSGTVPSARPAVSTPVRESTPPSATTLELTKKASIAGDKGYAGQGEKVSFTVQVKNVGSASTTGVRVTDPLVGELTCNYGPASVLPPGQSFACQGEYTVTAADVAAGGISNTATATTADATPPASASAFVPTAGLSLDATASVVPAAGGTAASARPGDSINYQASVTNNSSSDISGVSVRAPWLGSLSCQRGGSSITGEVALAAHETIACTASRTVTADDAAAGKVSGSFETQGTWADATLASFGPLKASASVSTDVEASPAGTGLVVSKSGTLISSHAVARVGDVVSYRVSVTNSSGVTAKGVKVKDPMFPLGMLCSPMNGGTLKAKATMTCIGVHFVTKADVAAGGITNTATATSTTPGVAGGNATAFTPAAGLDVTHTGTLVKASANKGTRAQKGDTIVFALNAKNASTQPMAKVTVSAALLRARGVPLTCQIGGSPVALPTDLPAGATLTCTTPNAGASGAYVVSSLDVALGWVLSTATVTGTWSGAASGVAVAPAAASFRTATSK